jgi:hypothetical protein
MKWAALSQIWAVAGMQSTVEMRAGIRKTGQWRALERWGQTDPEGV